MPILRALGCTCQPSVYNPRMTRDTNPECELHGEPNNTKDN